MHIAYQFPVDWIPQQCSKLTHLLLHQNLPVDFYHQFAFSYNSIQPLTIPATHDARTHKLLIPKYAICKVCILHIHVECICIAYCIFKNECILHCICIYACQKDCIYAIFAYAYAYMHTNHTPRDETFDLHFPRGSQSDGSIKIVACPSYSLRPKPERTDPQNLQ